MIKKKVIYDIPDFFDWVDVACELKERLNWSPVYFNASPELKVELNKRFPDVTVNCSYDGQKSIYPKEMQGMKLFPLDAEFLDSLSRYETIVIRMMGRQDMRDSFPYEERKRLYHRHLMFCSNILNHFKPDYVIFCPSPHWALQYILYILCKKKGVNTLIFNTLPFGNLKYISNFIGDLPKELLNNYQNLLTNNGEIELDKDLMEYYKKLQNSYEHAMPNDLRYFLKKNSLNSKYLTAIDLIVIFCRRFIKISVRPNIIFDEELSLVKGKNSTIEGGYPTRLELWLYRISAKKYNNKLIKIYKKKCKKPEFSNPYIFVALHYQPEETTLPRGGVYSDQFLMLNLLSMHLPLGWKIYVKEHPFQYLNELDGHQFRLASFYDDLQSIPNLELIDIDEESFKIIDHAKAVATITGTVGLEALIRNKPVLVFGDAWYRYCEGAFFTPNGNDVKEAIQVIEAGYKVNDYRVKAYMKSVEDYCFPAFIWSAPEETAIIDHAANVRSIVSGIEKFI